MKTNSARILIVIAIIIVLGVAAYALSNSGAGQQQSAAAVVTANGNNTGPAKPTGFNVYNASDNSISMEWDISSDPTVRYDIYRDNVYVANLPAVANCGQGDKKQVCYTDANLASGQNHVYTLDAYDTIGRHSGQAGPIYGDVISYNSRLSTPTGLKVTGQSNGSIALAWNPVQTGATKYAVYEIRDGVGRAVAFTTTDSATISGLGSGTTYQFSVAAIDNKLNYSTASQPVSGKTDGGTNPVCSLQPTSTTVTSGDSIGLNWQGDGHTSSATSISGIGAVLPPSGDTNVLVNSGLISTTTTFIAKMATLDGPAVCQTTVQVQSQAPAGTSGGLGSDDKHCGPGQGHWKCYNGKCSCK